MISERIENKIEDLGFCINTIGEGEFGRTEPIEYEIEFWSDAGEDVVFYIGGLTDREFVEMFSDYAASFDPDEHAETYISMRGSRGVPETIRELLDDADGIKKTLENAAHQLRQEVMSND